MRFYETDIYQAILNNDTAGLREVINADDNNDFLERDWDGRSYLHLAIDNNADPTVLELLLPKIDITTRDENGYSFLDLVHLKQLSVEHISIINKYISGIFLTGQMDQLDHMLLHGWDAWPECLPDNTMISQGVIMFFNKLDSFQVRRLYY